MNNIFKLLGCAFMVSFALASCSPEEFESADEAGIPEIGDAVHTVVVDQETNNVTFTLENEGMYPIWTIDGKTTTTNGIVKNYVLAGTYEYTLKVGNRNGVSDGEIKGSFTINTTRYDFVPTISKLAGDGTKEWRIYASKAGHLGCGEFGSDGSAWWSAGANEKVATGLYDDRITFSTDYKYTYNPGEDGMLYINNGVTKHSERYQIDADFNTPVSPMETTYSLDYDAADDVVKIKLPAGTLFPYMAGNSQYDAEYTFRILKIKDKTLELALDLPVENITWHYLLVNGEDEAEEEAFDPDLVNWCAVDSPENLGAGFNTEGTMSFWFADSGWAQIGDPGFSYANGVYSITVTDNGGSEWQAQCTIGEVPLDIEEGQYYDISCKIVTSAALDRVTIKVNKDPDVQDDPNTLYYNGRVELDKGENIIRFAKVMANNGGNPISFSQAKFILDLGGAPVGTMVSLSDIIIQKHNPK